METNIQKNAKVGILTFESFYGKQNIGSSRIRGHWLAKYWDEAEIFKMGRQYDVIIFQKVYWIEYAKKIREHYPDTIMILDLCDADFLHWGYRIVQMIGYCDAVTTSTLELAKFIINLTDKPVWCIADRLDLESFDALPAKTHAGNGDAKIAAWFGYSENFPMLDGAIMSLIKLGFKELIVIASRKQPYQLPATAQGKIQLTNYPWSPETVNADLQRADIVLNPQSKTGRFKYKSNNKTITAWALGLPVAADVDDLKALIPEEARINEAIKRMAEVHEIYDVKQSVEEFKNLIAQIQKTRAGFSKKEI
ncbi:MAG TPA: hypothetical protein VFX17_02205 [Patescibacteria group bacterium]|nr:hypothetical protein [Patescibacteria group bacterium]